MSNISKALQWFSEGLHKYPTVLFMALALPFGLLFAFTVPPLFGNDEIVHFPRAYQIQTGRLWEERLSEHDYGGRVPVQIKQFNESFRELVQSQTLDKNRLDSLIEQYSHESLVPLNTTSLAFTSAGVYSPWSYLPSAVGVGIARILDMPLIWYVWLGRIVSLVMWLALTVWAIRMLPSGKIFLVAVALLPTSLVQAANLGMDGIVNGLCWAIIAMTFAVMAGKIRLTRTRIAVLAFLCFFLATTKQGYLPIALLPLIIPAKLYAVDAKRVLIGRILFAVSLVGAGILYVLKTLPLASILHYTQRPGVYVDSNAQIMHIMQRPLEILFIIAIQPFTMFSGGVWAGTVGVITNKMIMLPVVVIGLMYLALVVAYFVGNKMGHFAGKYSLRVGVASLVVGVGTFVLINLALYTAFTSVANNHVEGLQGRYFLPFAPLAIGLASLFPRRWHVPVPRWAYIIAAVGLAVGLTTSLFKLAQLL